MATQSFGDTDTGRALGLAAIFIAVLFGLSLVIRAAGDADKHTATASQVQK